MSISPVSGQTPAAPVEKVGTDADGDNDGGKKATPAAPTPQVSKPTETMGNNVNTYA
ncbi:hypothetical protein [Rhodoferax sp. GW822-FHT02A01]|uniref:hypothetical protein n=1 Tax=Rhodoferax sp. GW822-FHT02A01 TaxID=3141537 RepID=UPI00315C69AF